MYLTPQARPYTIVPGASKVVDSTLLLQATEAPPEGMTGTTVVATVGEETFEATATLNAATGVATVTLTSAFTSELTAGSMGMAEFRFTLADSTVVPTRRVLRVAAQATYPTVTSAELTADYPDLTGALRASVASLRADLVEAWEKLGDDLFRFGLDINLVYDPRALARPHKILAAMIRYRKFGATNGDEDARSEALRLEAQYLEILNSGLVLDRAGDGAPDTARQAASPFHDIMRPHFPRSG